MQLKIHSFDLPLKHTFTISRASIDVKPTMIVELTDGEHRGYGEATQNNYYGASIEEMSAALDRVRPELGETELSNPAQLWNDLSPKLGANPFAQCALDQAAHDLWGKQQGKPVFELWGLTTDRIPASNYTIGIDTIDNMVAKLEEMPGWPVYKIKLGTANDIDIVRAMRQHTDATFRVDANCGWSADEAIENSTTLKELGVEFIEQPLAADDWAGAQHVYERSSLPIVADESCVVATDVSKCHDHFHGINIKLCKCGGLTPARRMIDEARSLGMSVMVGCMTESTVGISAIAQLLPLLDYVDMDGATLLAEDIATGVKLNKGVCEFNGAPGHGVKLTKQGQKA